ncbi:hypothetical protein ABE07_11665 [Bacillus thuringiensis]|uniref:hypothetical protein n=1 Tax=Bacillus thuringiensis TaxID=1428 RepID=UPI000676BA01|nr:hypothetical protein [Bacillus thuringiensis]MEB8878431.1 hypothetical protein [Bacillus cereus]AKR38644.1 Hypothetical protein NF53_p3082 [Bacillus thuringiensis serovar indiana]MBG9643387.1 hypothetical protein [Bacillus thuringiensis]MBG9649555.1 hypothetical protein [Bacillus thuringiensis]MEB9856477.1 hypothetical protein [Bacillus cereus]
MSRYEELEAFGTSYPEIHHWHIKHCRYRVYVAIAIPSWNHGDFNDYEISVVRKCLDQGANRARQHLARFGDSLGHINELSKVQSALDHAREDVIAVMSYCASQDPELAKIPANILDYKVFSRKHC